MCILTGAGLRLPARRQQLLNAAIGVPGQAGQYIDEMRQRFDAIHLDRLNQTHDVGGVRCCCRATTEEPIIATKPWPNLVLNPVVVQTTSPADDQSPAGAGIPTGRCPDSVCRQGLLQSEQSRSLSGYQIDPLLCLARQAHHLHWPERFSAPASLAKDATPMQTMAHRLGTIAGNAAYEFNFKSARPSPSSSTGTVLDGWAM
jgi:hypothetical protein